MKKLLLFTLLASGFMATSLWMTACKDEDPKIESLVFLPTESPYGKTYAAYAEDWLKQFYTADCDHTPWVHPANVLFYTDGPVYFLAGISAVGGSANISIPDGKAILFPLFNSWWDLPCPGFEVPAGQTVDQFLLAGVSGDLGNVKVSSLAVTIDGVSLNDLGSYKVLTGVFNLTGNPVLADCFDPCITGSPQPAATGGYYVIVKPLSRGQHQIHYHMEAPVWNAVQDATYNITVQ